jgi:hypothetical protein
VSNQLSDGPLGGELPQPPDYDAIWRSILNSPLATIYITELYWLSRNVVERAEIIFDKAKPASESHSYIQVDHDLLTNVNHLLGDSARIRALLLTRQKAKGESRIKHEVRARRTAWLRSTVLKSITLQHVLDAKVRHSLEHFDEYIDETAIKAHAREIEPPSFLPVDMLLGSRTTLDTFNLRGQQATVYPLRVYIADEQVFINAGKEISVRGLHDECTAIRDRLAPIALRSGEEEGRGSPIVVLTMDLFKN